MVMMMMMMMMRRIMMMDMTDDDLLWIGGVFRKTCAATRISHNLEQLLRSMNLSVWEKRSNDQQCTYA